MDSSPTRITDRSEFAPLLDYMKTTQRADRRIKIRQDHERDRLLADYRQRFSDQVSHDVTYNLQHLRLWAEKLASDLGAQTPVFKDGQIRDGVRRLNRLREVILCGAAWHSNRAEVEAGLAVQQFYCDALALAERLLRLEQGVRLRQKSATLIRRVNLPGAASNGIAQALMNAVEIALPGLLAIRPLRALAPIAWHLGLRTSIPLLPFHYCLCREKLGRVIRHGVLGSLNGCRGDVLRCHGVKELFGDAFFFDPTTGRTRHNLILAFSHRHSTIDLAILADVLHGRDYGIWLHALFVPRSAARDPRIVTVAPAEKKNPAGALGKSAEIMIERRLPLVIFVDGGVPYLPYGQQMRVKRGVRLLVEYLKANAREGRRRTWIVPVSLNDTNSFLRNLDQKITVTVHEPICADDITDPPDPPDRSLINYGDPLLNHLEAQFLVNTGQVRHGWHTPDVVETVRRVDQELGGDASLRGWMRRMFHPSLLDMARRGMTG